MNRYLAIAALALLAACTRGQSTLTQTPDSTGIIRGTAISASEPIHQSIVRVLAQGKKICTGVLVKDDVVLTAAHCFDIGKLKAEAITIHLPASDDLTCALANVQQISFAPNAEINGDGVHQPDIAVLKLSSKVCGARPAKIADRAAAVGETMTTAGFGIGTTSAKFADRIELKRVNSDWDSIEALYSEFDWNVPTDAAQLRKLRQVSEKFAPTYHFTVSQNPDQSFCVGDSGGPVYIMKDGEVNVVALNGAFLPNRKRGIRECGGAFLQLITPLEPQLAWIRGELEN